MTPLIRLTLPLSLLTGTLLFFSCGSPSTHPPTAAATTPYQQSGGTKRSVRSVSQPNITPAFIKKGSFGRHKTRSMSPRYITIHTTQSYTRGATAAAHARMLQRGAPKASKNSLGYLTWHYSVDDHSIYQSLPTNEQGQHADYEGPGNRYSIGIEMCENAGGNFEQTKRKTAHLVAWLMKKHNIHLRNVVGHCHWKRIRYADGRDLGYKNCPKPLLNNGKYGPKWNNFLRQIQTHL